MVAGEVRTALVALPEAQREALTLRYLAELSHREVAEQTGRSEAAVRQLCHRGLRSLRGLIEDPGSPDRAGERRPS